MFVYVCVCVGARSPIIYFDLTTIYIHLLILK